MLNNCIQHENKAVWYLVLLCNLFVCNTLGSRRGAEVKVLDFNVNDIFDEELMPMQIFSKQMHTLLGLNNSIEDVQLSPETTNSSSSDFNSAFAAMGFHRRMINEYMATQYIAEQILRINGSSQSELLYKYLPIEKRVGLTQNEYSVLKNETNRHISKSNHRLFEDEGMKNYKSWLERTSLEDVHQRHGDKSVSQGKAKPNKSNNRRQSVSIETAMDDEDEQDFEDGDLTGYAMTSNPYDYYHQNTDHSNHLQPLDIQMKAQHMPTTNKNGYDAGYDDYGVHSLPPQSHTQLHSGYTPVATSNQTKEIGLKDITDIALTTLAFLSFGMFILQVLMCITMGKDDASNMMMMPMEATDPADIPGDGTEEIRRRRRSISYSDGHLITMNEVARRMLLSIDGALHISKEDNSSCHHWSLCENNQYAKHQINSQKIWIPILSLGLSWLRTKVLPNGDQYISIIPSLKAVLMGMFGESDCNKLLTDVCM